MSTFQMARQEARDRIRVVAHPLRFILGALLTGSGAALFLSDVARWIAGGP